jgi:predicted nuclease of predicted toxin-antitoxin system
VKFLVDSQLPPALARWISTQGHEAAHIVDLGLIADDDSKIWEYAKKEGAIIISKDEDFADRWLLSNGEVALIWIRKGNCSNHSLLSWLEPLWPEILRRLEQGERLIELRA